MMYFVEKLPKEKKWKRKEKTTDRAEWNNVTVPKWVSPNYFSVDFARRELDIAFVCEAVLENPFGEYDFSNECIGSVTVTNKIYF